MGRGEPISCIRNMGRGMCVRVNLLWLSQTICLNTPIGTVAKQILIKGGFSNATIVESLPTFGETLGMVSDRWNSYLRWRNIYSHAVHLSYLSSGSYYYHQCQIIFVTL